MSTSFFVQDPRVTAVATVSTAGISNIIDMQGYRPVAIDMSTAWTAASLSFLGGNDTTTLFPLYDSTAEVAISSALVLANVSLAFRQDFSHSLGAHRYIQVRSGTSTAQSTQADARALTLVLLPY